MDSGACTIRGDLLNWARIQQDLTMRWIQEHGGPSLGYQSEVERSLKKEVGSDVLSRWIPLLSVTDAFARGLIPRYHEDNAACKGLAADIGQLVSSGRSDLPDWAGLNPLHRTREVLGLIARESRYLPRIVLAYVLGLTPATLDDAIAGQHPINRVQMAAVADLTTLPEEFFTHGRLDLHQRYQAVVRQAMDEGVTPEELLELLDQKRRSN